MIDNFFEFLYKILPVLHVLAGIALLLKMIIVFRAKGFNIHAVLGSFFRIYNRSERYMARNISRQQYMRINNYINYYLYAWIVITIIILLVFQSHWQ